jgi:HPt (histidine-containing phosphotransfer) domain-containing protein
MENSHPMLSPAYELADGDKAFLAEILESMANGIPADIHEIEKALEHKQLSLICRSAHHMKSSIMYTNAVELRELLTTMETIREHPAAVDQEKVLWLKAKELATQITGILKEELKK